VSQTVSVLAALGASGSAVVAATLQARSAGDLAKPNTGAVDGLMLFARSQLSRGLWWGSLLVQALGFALHAAALSAGALTLVQPLMASSVVLALPLNHLINRTRVVARELVAAAALAVGLSGFLISSAARPVGASTSPYGAVAVLLAVGAIAACVAAARRTGRATAATLLGAAAAVAFAVEAALLQLVAGRVLAGSFPITTYFEAGGLALAGVAGVALTQLAYRIGPMSSALPAILLVNPLLSVVYGVTVQHDTFRHTPEALTVAALSCGVLVIGAVVLTRQPEPSVPDRWPVGCLRDYQRRPFIE
jgi:drug/metabolite transporter (DMT)-like permease